VCGVSRIRRLRLLCPLGLVDRVAQRARINPKDQPDDQDQQAQPTTANHHGAARSEPSASPSAILNL